MFNIKQSIDVYFVNHLFINLIYLFNLNINLI